MEQPALCPVCQKAMEWKQINFHEAVEICIDLNCPFPAQHHKCRIRRRNLKDIKKVPKPPAPKKDELLDLPQFDLPLQNTDDNFLKELDEFLFGVHNAM
ncbi:uncharacterized protein LOC123320424 [Coccinella septempunctata]|uniref:uncharacterized protein LOC123320424 n=1 Tax=Coccinella septempunctata TaxID=41139 RepID=UPI001D080527|nr:uncharacterized protein LOC123320424 [Coccinella septempunctata]